MAHVSTYSSLLSSLPFPQLTYRHNEQDAAGHFEQMKISDDGLCDEDIVEDSVNSIILGDQVPL